MWMYVNNVPLTDFGMVAPEWPSLQQKGKPLSWIMERIQPCFNIGSKACLCFSQERKEAQLFPESLVWCVEPRSTSPDDILDAEASFPGKLQWVCDPDLCCSLEGREITVLVDDCCLPERPTAPESYLLWNRPKDADWISGHVSTKYHGTQKLTLPGWCSVCCRNRGPENWDLKFPLWGKETC